MFGEETCLDWWGEWEGYLLIRIYEVYDKGPDAESKHQNHLWGKKKKFK